MAVFPLFIYVQKQMVLMNNHMPVVQKMQEQVAKARRSGDMLEGKLVGVVCRAHCYRRQDKFTVEWVIAKFDVQFP